MAVCLCMGKISIITESKHPCMLTATLPLIVESQTNYPSYEFALYERESYIFFPSFFLNKRCGILMKKIRHLTWVLETVLYTSTFAS